MEKYGIEKDVEVIGDMEKVGVDVEVSTLKSGVTCSHPSSIVEIDGDVQFCHGCSKYINRREN